MTRIVFETATNTYTSEGIIGEGGCGAVYRVTDTDGAPYALKLLRDASSAKRKRFKNELAFCRRNEHERIVKVLDEGVLLDGAKRQPFYVMPLYEKTLRKSMNASLGPDEVLPFFSGILDGVEAAHLLKVIHRDLKPENILVTHDGRAVVADFGIAHFEEDNLITAVNTREADRLANFRYSAPEQRISGRPVDQRADIFALGLILNEMFTGEVAQGAGYKLIKDVAPACSYLDEIVEKMIRQDPAQRHSSVTSLKSELITRGAEFMTLQKLDAARKEVVPASSPDDRLGGRDVNAIGFDYIPGYLTFRLEPTHPPEWMNALITLGNFSSTLGGARPSRVGRNTDGTYGVPADANNLDQVAGFVRQWVNSANGEYRRRLQEAATEKEQIARQNLEAERRRLEEQARGQKKLRDAGLT